MLITGNIGIVLYEDVNYVRANLLSEAEVALSQAKSKGLGFYALYDLRLNEKILQRLALAAELRLALERNELRLYYQPKIFLKNGQLEGVEALVRWQHPIRGVVNPAEFIPMAEETGIINALGKWVMKEACLQAKRMNSAIYNHPPLLMSINISVRQFQQHDLVEQVEQIISETGVNPFYIQFEISEGIVIEEMDDVVDKLKKLKALGVRLALDDFGTGYSNLRYLKYLPIDTLKIDKSLIMGFDRDLEIIAFVQSVIGLGHSMNLMVVAEGVENMDELVKLQNVGCDLGQGFYFARPMTEEALNTLLTSEKSKAQIVTTTGKVASVLF
jgi:EAL domain-containing protein (putative c-di-GMP-specific phosphodiesterase class I)